MLKFDISRGATVAGIGLIVMPVFALLLERGAPGVWHYVVAALGCVLLAVAGAANAGR